MEPKMMMFIASVVGALVGVLYISSVGPLNNYAAFMFMFALAGMGAANLVLMLVIRIFDWVREPAKKEKSPVEEKPKVVVSEPKTAT